MPWSQLGPEFLAVWGRPRGKVQPEHVSIYGQSGSGKSYFQTHILQARAAARGTHVVMIATKKADKTLADAGWPVIDDWPPDWGKHQVIFWAKGGLSEDQQDEQARRVRRIMNDLWKPDANKIVAWDELPYISADLGLRRQVATYYREGRSLGITNTAVLQRPTDVPRYVHSEAGWIVSFAPEDEDDRDRVAQVFGNRREIRDYLDSLDRERREFLIRRKLTGEMYISNLPDRPLKQGR